LYIHPECYYFFHEGAAKSKYFERPEQYSHLLENHNFMGHSTEAAGRSGPRSKYSPSDPIIFFTFHSLRAFGSVARRGLN
jgi:hypothetical protein